MTLWVVVTSDRNCGLPLVVDAIIERQDLPDGRFRWVVDAPEHCRELLQIVPGVLSVEPKQSGGMARSA